MTPKISSAVHSLLAGVSSLAAASVAVADPQLTNLSECPGAAETQSCACADASHSSADNGCIKINLAMGLSTPWTGSRTAAIKVFSDDFAPSVFTPETLHARIQVQEHIAFPEALNILASGKYRIEGRRVRIG